MTCSTAYKSYTFNCCWLLVDFPGVGRGAVEESREINQRNNETRRQGGNTSKESVILLLQHTVCMYSMC